MDLHNEIQEVQRYAPSKEFQKRRLRAREMTMRRREVPRMFVSDTANDCASLLVQNPFGIILKSEAFD